MTRPAAWHPILATPDCYATLVVPLHQALADPHFQSRGLFNGRVEVPGGGELTAIPAQIALWLQ